MDQSLKVLFSVIIFTFREELKSVYQGGQHIGKDYHTKSGEDQEELEIWSIYYFYDVGGVTLVKEQMVAEKSLLLMTRIFDHFSALLVKNYLATTRHQELNWYALIYDDDFVQKCDDTITDAISVH